MKKLRIFKTLIFILGVSSAQAKTVDVLVQCSSDTQVYKGTFVTMDNQDIKCDGAKAPAFAHSKKPFILKFHAVTYEALPNVISFKNQNCDLDQISWVAARTIEVHSGLPLAFNLASKEGGYEGTLGICSFKTASK